MSGRKALHRFHTRSISLSWLLTGVLALALAITLGVSFSGYAAASSTQTQQAADEQAAKDVVLTAFGASVREVVLPNTPASFGSTKVTTKLAAATLDITTAKGQAQALFNSVYAPNCNACKGIVAGTYKSIEGQANGRYRALGWGVRDVEWRQVLVNGQEASVTLAATLWSKVQYIDEFGKLNTVTPTGGLVKIYTLNKINGHWLVTNQVQDDLAANSLPVNQVKPNGKTGAPPANEPPPVKHDVSSTTKKSK